MQWLIDIIMGKIEALAYATEAWVLAKTYATEAWVLGKDYQSGADIPEWTKPLMVTGDINPDVSCTYLKGGVLNSQPYYERLDGSYFIFWDGVNGWHICPILGATPLTVFRRIDPNILGDYAPRPGSTGIAAVSIDYHYLKTGFVDRGDPGAVDYSRGDLTNDKAWHDLDLSGIVPAGVKAVSLYTTVRNPLVQEGIKFRRNGNVNEKNISEVITQVANLYVSGDCTVPLDANRLIEYNSGIGFLGRVYVTVKGWWL